MANTDRLGIPLLLPNNAANYAQINSAYEVIDNAAAELAELQAHNHGAGSLGQPVTRGDNLQVTNGATIQLALAVLGRLTATRFVVPGGPAFPTTPAPEAGDIWRLTSENRLYIYSGTVWLPAGAGGSTAIVSSPGIFPVPTGIQYIFVTTTGVTIQLPAANVNQQNPPITVSPNYSVTCNVTATGGGVHGGSINTANGQMTNGQITSGPTMMDSISYKSDGANWRYV